VEGFGSGVFASTALFSIGQLPVAAGRARISARSPLAPFLSQPFAIYELHMTLMMGGWDKKTGGESVIVVYATGINHDHVCTLA
jgi:hypothetical protein